MTRKILVGMFLLGALIIFGIATFYIEDWQVYLREGYRLNASFSAADRLDEGDLVRLSGVSVGKVITVTVDTAESAEKPVKATMLIDKGITVKAQDEAQIKTASLFGGNYVSIERGPRDAPALKPGEEMTVTSVSPSVTDLIASAGKAMDSAEETIQSVNDIASSIKGGKGTIGKLVTDEKAYDEMVAFMSETRGGMEEMKAVLNNIKTGKGLLGKLMTDKKLAEDVDVISSNLRNVSTRLNEGQGTLGKLLANEQLYERLNTAAGQGQDAFSELKKVAESARTGDGLMAKLLKDPQMAERVDSISADLQVTAKNLRNLSKNLENGTLGRLATDEEAYNKLMSTLDSVNKTSEALAEGKGTLGLLIQDRELYDTATRVVENLENMLEDYREQSPVITFAGSVFGAF